MPNSLTGACEAVVQVSVKWINGLLATLHQNGATPDASPSFPHSESLQVGDAPLALDPGVKNFNDWLMLQQALYPVSLSQSGAWTVDLEKAPPGIAGKLNAAAVGWNTAIHEQIAANRVSGLAQIQFSTPQVSFNNRLPIVYSSVFIRAHYFRSANSKAMPAPIHGEVRVNYTYQIQDTPRGKMLNVPFPAIDSDIQFIPAPGTVDAAGDQELTHQIRTALRKSFQPMQVPLPADFPFSEFKAIGASSDQALALAVQLPGAPPPPTGGLFEIDDHFLAGASFGIAVSATTIRAKFEPMLAQLRQFTTTFTVEVPVWVDPTYRFSITSADLKLIPGFIELVVMGKATTRYIGFPDYNSIVITQRITITLQGQDVLLQASDSDLTVSGLPSDAVAAARSQIIAQRNQQLPGARETLRQGFESALAKLNAGVQRFDAPSTARYDSTEITPEGLIVRGSIDTPVPRRPPVVSIRWTEGFECSLPNFTAFASWFPGGRITSYHWSLFEIVRIRLDSGIEIMVPWEGKVRNFPTDSHRFIFRHPTQIGPYSRACLTVDGEQFLPNGDVITGLSAYGATGSCRPSHTEPVFVLPPGLKNPLVPIWYPPEVWTPESIFDTAIAGHAAAGTPQPIERGINHVVHFADWEADQPLAALSRSLQHVARRGYSFVVYVVVPAGGLQLRRGDVEAKLGFRGGRAIENSDERQPPIRFQLVEDYDRAWSETLGVEGRSTTFLINARGEYVWQRAGELDPGEFGGAMEEYALEVPPPQYQLMELHVHPGQRAPDVNLTDSQGRPVALRRLKGRSVLLTFWQSGLQPCINELCRLQELVEQAEQRAPFVVAVCGDVTADALEEVRHENRLSYALAHDPYQRVTQAFGVTCWPTTVSINPDGVVNHIQFGTVPPRRKEERSAH